MEDLKKLLHNAYRSHINVGIVTFVCLFWVCLCLFMIYETCRIRKGATIVKPKKSKKIKKAKQKERHEVTNSSSGQTNSRSANGAESENMENVEDDVDLDLDTEVDLHEGVSHDHNPQFTKQSDHPDSERFSGSKTWKKNDKKKGKQREYAKNNRSRRYPPQRSAQPWVDPSQIVKLSDMQNSLRAMKAKYRQQEVELGSYRQTVAGLQIKLREYREENARLLRTKANIARRLEDTRPVECGLYRRPHTFEAKMAEMRGQTCSAFKQ